jgi:hypothetical protein
VKKIYQISKVALVLGFERIDIHEDGAREVKTNQTLTYDKLYTPEQLIELMKAKIAPGETIECLISPDVLAQ